MSYYAPELPPAPPAPPSNTGRELLSALVVAVVVAVAGVILGLVWYLLAPPLPLKKVEGGLAFTSPQPEQLAAQDGWFTILGFVFGVLAALAAWTLARRYRGPVQLFALLIGAVGAGFLAWQIGTKIDQGEYRQAVASAPMGTVIDRPIELSSSSTRTCLAGWCVTTRGGDILVPGLGTVIAYAVLAGWSRWPSLRREEEHVQGAAFPVNPYPQGAAPPVTPPDSGSQLVQGGGRPELGEVRRDGPDLPQQ